MNYQHPGISRMTSLVLKNQRRLINKLNQTIQVYEELLSKQGFYHEIKKMPIEKKAKFVEFIQNGTGNKLRLLKKLRLSRTIFRKWEAEIKDYKNGTLVARKLKKFQKAEYRDAIFEILHAPPKNYGFNRTSWRLPDIHTAMKNRNLPIGKNYIIRIIKEHGFRFRSAKKVLTSTDPAYREKLMQITNILSNLKPNEKFFSIDEYGPFSVKIQGGKTRVLPGKGRIVPQFQKSKGCIIMTAALELSTNQIIHFYSTKKNTDEMIKLMNVLLDSYKTQKRLFLSWDAASWHASKKLYQRVEINNKTPGKPKIELAPLPACAQFLNVIESVFSGMSKAIIQNSNYQSVSECKSAIDKYFMERNNHFKNHPKRAAKKLWGQERVEPVFKESNNCKDPKYLHNY